MLQYSVESRVGELALFPLLTTKEEEEMGRLIDEGKELEDLLRLKGKVVAYRKLEKAEELSAIPNVHIPERTFTFCQVPFMVRALGMTVGATENSPMLDRCMRLHGLKNPDADSMARESAMLSTTWFGSAEEAMEQQKDYKRIPAGGAIAAAPLTDGKFEPDVVLIYGNPAQIMMIMCGLQKEKYEKFQFSFIGEGACADSLGQCYVDRKPALAIPCYGERALGQVADDEIVIALPPDKLAPALSGIRKLAKVRLSYPVSYIGGLADVIPILSQIYTMHR
ncbi:MAG: hypothetical protein C4520_10190 [Candidatus Abyssobacteria bacterium SURF_5]|uniref:DUF169 domain-containing protein n=1 Tax=Abyssobacteria bacterium (strain SURF_5) TaxID=2093360 RepID=A0A3A4NL24_ABYX5|nr:MAG: hypothetical protein C4520_10190 [Candidatus Abyssubacteria bacterium SURF_5]